MGALETGRFKRHPRLFGSGKGGGSTGQLGVFAIFNQKWENNSGVTTTQRSSVTMALFNKLAFRKLYKNKTQGDVQKNDDQNSFGFTIPTCLCADKK